METVVILEVLKIAAEVGIPTVTNIIKDMKKENITMEDVNQLKQLVKKPEDYFKK